MAQIKKQDLINRNNSKGNTSQDRTSIEKNPQQMLVRGHRNGD